MFSFVFAVRLLLLLLFLFKQHSFAAINVWKKAFHRWGFVVVFSFYFFWNFSYLEIYYPNRVGSQALCNTSICGELFGMQQSQISQTYSNRFYGSFMLMQPDSFLAKKKLLSSSENGESGRVQRLRMRIVVAREWDQNAHIKPHKSTAYRILCAEWQNPLYAIFGWCLALIKVNPCSGSVSSGRQCWAKREKIFEYA